MCASPVGASASDSTPARPSDAEHSNHGGHSRGLPGRCQSGTTILRSPPWCPMLSGVHYPTYRPENGTDLTKDPEIGAPFSTIVCDSPRTRRSRTYHREKQHLGREGFKTCQGVFSPARWQAVHSCRVSREILRGSAGQRLGEGLRDSRKWHGHTNFRIERLSAGEAKAPHQRRTRPSLWVLLRPSARFCET